MLAIAGHTCVKGHGLSKAFVPAGNSFLREENGTFLVFLPHFLAALIVSDRYSLLPAITLDGIVECTIVEGSFNTDLFMGFIEDLLEKMQPFPAPNSVIVMDNCVIHKAPEIRELIESRYVNFSFAISCKNDTEYVLEE